MSDMTPTEHRDFDYHDACKRAALILDCTVVGSSFGAGFTASRNHKHEEWPHRAIEIAAAFEAARAERDEAVRLLDAARCPNCDGSGATLVHACGGDSERCYRTCPQTEQCQWCYERNAIFAHIDAETK